MRTIRKTIAALLILLVMFSVMPGKAFAEAPEGSAAEEEMDRVDVPQEEEDPGTGPEAENTVGEQITEPPEETVNPEEDAPEEPENREEIISAEEETAITEEVTEDDPDADEDKGDVAGGDIPAETEDGDGESDPSEPEEKEIPEICAVTLVLGDIRDDIKVFLNGERIAWIYGNPSPRDGSYFIAREKGPEELKTEADGTTRVTFEAAKGDEIRIETLRPDYASVRFTNALVIREYDTDKYCNFTAEIESETYILMDADYSKSAGWYGIPVQKRAMLRSDPDSPVLPDSIYVVLEDKYDDYSGSAMINGHTGVWYFDPEDPSGLYVSAACGNTSKKMVTGTHYKVARISEEAAREYLDYGDGCCSPRTQRALAWVTHHGQTEYDWRAANEGTGKMGDGKIAVSSHLEAYTITFLASWVLTNDGREGAYGTVNSEDGAVALDAMFGSEFSTGLPASTKNAIDRMVAMGFAFSDKHTDGDDSQIDEYMETFIYSDGDAVHQPLLIGAYRGHSHGYLTVKKVSAVPTVTDGNGCYSLAGTVFRVTDENGAEVGALTSDEKGNTDTLELESGTYTVTEVSTGNGYIRNVTANTVEIVSYETTETSFQNEAVFDPAGMHLAKWDKEADSFVPQGAGSFSGAEYRIDYYDNYSWSGQPERSWVFRTDEAGTLKYLPSYKVSGDDMYEVMGAYVFPLGSIKITETKAPAGYLMSTDALYATIERNGDRARFSWTTETLGLIKAFQDGTGVPEKAIRGGIKIRKADAETGLSVPQGNARLDSAVYTVYAAEAVIIDGKQYVKGDAVLTMVTDTEGIASTADRALSYGSYYIRETKAPVGYLLDESSKPFRIESDCVMVDLTGSENVSLEAPVKGGVMIGKADSDTGLSRPQGEAKLSGAEFTVYASEAMQIDGKQYRAGEAVLTVFTDAEGIAKTAARALPYGNYFIKETKAPEGYLINETVREFSIESDGTMEDLSTGSNQIKEKVIKGGVAIRKADAVTGQPVPSGEGALAGAEYTVYAAKEMYIGEKKYSAGDAVLTLVTDKEGKAETAAGALPYGNYYIRETKAPEGYLADDARKDFRIAEDGVVVDLTGDVDAFRDVPVMGGVSVRKTDAVTDKSEPQGDAKLSGAEFTVYAAADMSIEGKKYSAGDAVLTIVTGEDAIAKTDSKALPYGHYYIKETKAPEGYLINEERKDFFIEEDGVVIDFTSDEDAVAETSIRGGARFRKVDRETGGGPQGCGALEGAEITIYNASERYVYVNGEETAPGELVCVIITGADGYAETEDMILPYGTYTAKETRPSEGYFLREDWSVTFSIREDGETADLTAEDDILREQVIRGDLTLLKLDVDGKPMANIPFMIEALDKKGNVTERHVMVTDDKGRLDTASRRNTNSTNSLDEYTDGAVFGDSTKLDPSAGVWFGAGEPDDSLGALPYGPYRVYELQTEETGTMRINLLESGIEVLDSDHLLIDLGAMVDLSVMLESDALCADTGLDIVPAADEAHVTDTVRYRNLTAGRRYTLETRFVLQSDILTEVGKTETDFVPDTGEFGKTTSSGYVTAYVVIDTTELAGQTLVAFDRLYEYVDGKKVLIASHEDTDDVRQQLRIPAIATTAKDTDTGDHVGKVSDSSGIEDTVFFTNLKKGEMFRLSAVLADPATGELLKDSSGSILGTDMYFICSEEEGEITMPEIRIDSRGPEGGSATVQEKLYLVKEGEEILMAAHEDLGDKEQTVTYPQIRTSAVGKDTGDHTAPVSEKTVIEDTIILKGLVPGNEYTLKGRLVYKEDFVDGLWCCHRAGEEIVIRTYSFLADSEETEIVLSFEIDSVLLEGTGVVVFEDLIHNGVAVASHADLADESQSVYFPSVITWASDVKSGTQFVSKGKETVLRDIVQLRGLLPGRSYVVRGQLVNRYSGKPMISDYRSGVFTAEESEMDVIVDMVMDTTEINCFSGVMFESLYLVKEDGTEVLLSSHEDIFDEDQALYLPGISTTATDAMSGTHEAQGREKTTIIDEVIYCDLMPLEEYTIEGVLMNAYTGEPVLADGKPVTASVKICPEYPDGSVFLTFLFDARELTGQKAVVFEKLYWKDRIIASHQDLEDDQQTVSIIDIGTYAKDPDTNTKYLGLDTAVRVLDTVKYTGLTPGKTYTLRGSLLYDDGSVVAQYGEPVTSETEFVPESPDGEAQVEFVLDTLTLPGQRLVVYEKLFAGTSAQNPKGDTSPIAVHEDLNDEDQTVYVPQLPEEPVNTGDRSCAPDVAIAMASGAGIYWVMTDDIRRARRNRKKEERTLTKRQ